MQAIMRLRPSYAFAPTASGLVDSIAIAPSDGNAAPEFKLKNTSIDALTLLDLEIMLITCVTMSDATVGVE